MTNLSESSRNEIQLEFDVRVRRLVRATVVARRLLGQEATDYLHSRGILPSTIEEWDIGWWDPGLNSTVYVEGDDLRAAGFSERLNSRITFPLNDLAGVTRGFVGRQLPGDESPVRYLYPDKSPFHDRRSSLFGADHYIKKFPLYHLILVEGPIDVISMQQQKLPAVGCHTSVFTLEQALLIRSLCRRLTLFPDGDTTGEKMIDRAKKYRHHLPDHVYVVPTPPDKDPASLAGTAVTYLDNAYPL